MTADNADRESDTEMSESDSDASSSSASSHYDVPIATTFVPLKIDPKIPRFTVDGAKPATNGGENFPTQTNPYFVVDINPTPVRLSGNGTGNNGKKRAKAEQLEGRKSKKAKKEIINTNELETEEPIGTAEPAQQEVDFTALEAKLQAEVDAGMKAQEQLQTEITEANKKKSKDKRRRSSDGDGDKEVAAKKARKEAKKDKKERKRKVDDSADGAEVDGGKKKKRKHKVDFDSEKVVG